MTISIIGPEGSGKTTLIDTIVKKAAHGRPVYFVGRLKTRYIPISMDDFHKPMNAVLICDDALAYMETFETSKKNAAHERKEPIVMSRHYNRLNIFAFHSLEDSVKFFLRRSKYVYVSDQFADKSYEKKFFKGITPEFIGKGKHVFRRYKQF